jgi:hypothetical protein
MPQSRRSRFGRFGSSRMWVGKRFSFCTISGHVITLSSRWSKRRVTCFVRSEIGLQRVDSPKGLSRMDLHAFLGPLPLPISMHTSVSRGFLRSPRSQVGAPASISSSMPFSGPSQLLTPNGQTGSPWADDQVISKASCFTSCSPPFLNRVLFQNQRFRETRLSSIISPRSGLLC